MKQTFTSARRPLEILIHIISWGIMFGFPFFFVERGNGNINWMAYIRHLAVPLSFMIAFYVNYFILVPRYLFQSQAKRYIVYNIIFLCVIGILLHLWQSLTFDPSFAPKAKRPGMPPGWLFFLRDMLSLVFTIGLSAAIRMSARWTQNEAARKEAERNRAEAELKNLRNQLNPHFLLNTLNNIYALIAFDSDKAQQAVQELSKLLRYVLYDNQQTYVPLCKEVDFIRNYIELMRIRLSANVQMITKFDIQPDSQTLIAPLIFISLIENAFKHGISPTESSFISIHLSENDKEVICEIRNSNHPKTVEDKSGSGNQTVLFPQRIDENIASNDPVRIVNTVVDNLNLDNFKKLYKATGRCPYHPKMMLKVIIYSYMNNIYSCRKIEKLLLCDIHYIWLSANEHPDFTTINRFRNRAKEEINTVFTQLVLVLADKGFISLDVEHIYGSKIEFRANKYTFVWRKTVEKNRTKLMDKIRILLE